ncbi:hypothetical protein JVU11DRAFT_7500 [Chiua virens]|nr:hypothetical protein JVU11DRAFT_7500 [Chiua virens]
MVTQTGYSVNDYSWEATSKVPRPSFNSTETILTVFFDFGAQHLFSNVRINVGLHEDVPASLVEDEYNFVPGRSHPSIINRDSSMPLETDFSRPDLSSLPTLDIIFEVESMASVPGAWDVRSNSRINDVPMPMETLTFKDSGHQIHRILLEVNQPLTPTTQSVSVSFTSSPLLYTPGQRGSGRPLDDFSTIGRVVQIRPAFPPHGHKAILLPTEILFMIFRNFSESSDVCSRWRTDLLSCALVCKQWTCALELMLDDFHYPEARIRPKEYPPEICKFASAIASRPTLALSITHLSPIYFFKHADWKPLTLRLLDTPFQPPRRLARIEQFVNSFLSILRLARNLRSLAIPLGWNMGPSEDFLDMVRGLDKIEEVDMMIGSETTFQACLATWPTLKRLTASFSEADLQIKPQIVPTTPPGYALTAATLLFLVSDEQLNYLLCSSSSSLEALEIRCFPLWLTNTGLHSVLQSVSKSLVTLEIILTNGSSLDKVEEYALDSLIVDMVRLKELRISPTVATQSMIERRAEAFEGSHASGSPVVLPPIHLTIDTAGFPRNLPKEGLIEAASRIWPGWRIEVCDG